MLELVDPLLDNQNTNNELQNINSNMSTINTSNNNICLSNYNNAGINDHFNPSVRLLQIKKTINDGCCGFHLSRSKWDPYPWVSAIDETTPAELTGLKVGDCVLEVNGEDILGLRISEIANLVKANPDNVTLLLWSTGNDPSCDPQSLCCGPMPLSLERLSASMQTILASLECPVCMEAIPSPVLQCQNGHILCIKCRARSEKCPVCRERYSVVRSLIAEQIYSSILSAFQLQDNNNRQQSNRNLREKLFGAKYKKKTIFDTNSSTNSKFCNIQKPANKFLAKILGKSCSLDSLSHNTDKCKENIKSLEIENITKAKHLSLSTNDLSNTGVNLVAIPRCPSANRLHADDIVGSLTLNGLSLPKRPLSLNASVENIGFDIENLSIPVPKRKIILENLYICPFGCKDKIKVTSLENHVRKDHNTPIITFSGNSTEISLPPKAPIENAVYILILDDKQFWLKLTIDKTDNSIFIMALLQGTSVESSKYMLEARLRNQVENKLLEKVLITRSIVYSLMEISWNINNNNNNSWYCNKYSSSSGNSCNSSYNKSIGINNFIHYPDGSNSDDEILDKQYGIFYNQNIIKATFNQGSDLLLKIDVKRRNDDEQ